MDKSKFYKLTRWMLWVHRYIGFVLSLLFLLWFLSGFVMIYKDFPYLSRAEALKRMEVLPSAQNWLSPKELSLMHHLDKHSWESIRIVADRGRPLYKLQDDQEKFHCFYADTGEKTSPFSRNDAKSIVSLFVGKGAGVNRVEKMTELDQWTPRTRFLPYLPAFRVYLDDGKGTVCYVSSVTGEVFQMLNRTQKIWAWLGAIPHWIYFKDLRIHTQHWRNVVVGLSILGTIMCIAGLYIGIVRVRKKKHPAWAFSPYKKMWFKWHHYTGFVFGLFTFTWILSGLFSMNPWNWSPSTSLNDRTLTIWQGGSLTPRLFSLIPGEVIDEFNNKNQKVSELSMIRFGGKPFYQAWMADGVCKLLPGDQMSIPLDGLSTKAYSNQVKAMHPEVKNLQVTVLKDYDAYYYHKHRVKPLPVVKIDIDNEANTTYYINPKTTEVLMKYETTSRINRWVYHGLHSLDFPELFTRRPLWDVIVIVFMLGGTSVSITGVVLTWKWVKRKVVGKTKLKRTIFNERNNKKYSI